eukprot:10490731-Alexandrium_andersonii.AAC.1
MAALLFEAITCARSARQAASIATEQVAWQLTEVTGAGADSVRDLSNILGKLGQLLNEAADLVMNGIAVLLTDLSLIHI